MTSFKNRLIKIDKHISKWARRQSISCFRIYDKDIPEFPFIIDRYEDILSVYILVKDKFIEKPDYNQWIQECINTISISLNTDLNKIYIKERQKQKGKSQYDKQSHDKTKIIANESNLKFILNLTDYLDTGLFLDHRITRAMVKEDSKDKHFLNLFAYTGSFTVYAADENKTNELKTLSAVVPTKVYIVDGTLGGKTYTVPSFVSGFTISTTTVLANGTAQFSFSWKPTDTEANLLSNPGGFLIPLVIKDQQYKPASDAGFDPNFIVPAQSTRVWLWAKISVLNNTPDVLIVNSNGTTSSLKHLLPTAAAMTAPFDDE